MSVITFSNEIGSLGTQVAEQVAHTLRYRLADKATIGAILNEYGMEDFEEEYKAIPGFWERLDVPHMKHRFGRQPQQLERTPEYRARRFGNTHLARNDDCLEIM